MRAPIALSLVMGLSALGLALSGAARADVPTGPYASLQGKWRLNEAESHYPAGFRKVHDDVFDVQQDDGKVLKFTESATLPNGERKTYDFDWLWNGVGREASDGSWLAYRHLTPRTFYFRRKYPLDAYVFPYNRARADRTEYCLFSADGATLTCSDRNPPGYQKVLEVFDRVS